MMHLGPPQSFKVEPNPAAETGQVNITGPAGTVLYTYRRGGKGMETVTIGPDGSVTIDVPAGTAETFTISDGRRPPDNTFVVVSIIQSVGK